MDIDVNTDFGARVTRHLEDDRIVWLTTIGLDGTPQPSPVWFIWDGEAALIYSQPSAPKLRNIAQHPRVSLNFNCTPTGGDVVILTGDGWIDTESPPASEMPAYVEKYTQGIRDIGMTPDAFAHTYSVALRVSPTSLRGH